MLDELTWSISVYLNPNWAWQAKGMAKPKGNNGVGVLRKPLAMCSTILVLLCAHWGEQYLCKSVPWYYHPIALPQGTNGWCIFELEWDHLGGKEVERRQGGPSSLNPTLFSLLY